MASTISARGTPRTERSLRVRRPTDRTAGVEHRGRILVFGGLVIEPDDGARRTREDGVDDRAPRAPRAPGIVGARSTTTTRPRPRGTPRFGTTTSCPTMTSTPTPTRYGTAPTAEWIPRLPDRRGGVRPGVQAAPTASSASTCGGTTASTTAASPTERRSARRIFNNWNTFAV